MTRVPDWISFDRVAETYDESRGLPAPAAAAVLDRLASELAGRRLFEAGVGTGRWGAALQRRGIAVVGVDVGPRMLARSFENGLREGLLADVRSLPFRDRSFDMATTNHLLHLVARWPVALAEIARVTRTEYLSILELEDAEPDLNALYRKRAGSRGAYVEHPGLPERELAKQLPPDRKVADFGPFVWKSPATTVLDQIRRRQFRVQWEIPPALHDELVGELIREFASVEVLTTLRVEVASWRVGSIAEFAARARVPTPTPSS